MDIDDKMKKRIRGGDSLKRFLSILLCVTILFTLVSHSAMADGEPVPTPSEEGHETSDISAVIVSNLRGVDELIAQRKFSYSRGKGFAAEYGNNLIDRIKGTNARVIGDSNQKNGADRIILGRNGETVLIQTKYYNSAENSLKASFGPDGMYKYLKSDGTPMKLEVPKDQYDEVVAGMRRKIQEGKVSGVTDPNEAENIVHRGNMTFKQAENLAKAGTVESLTCDIANGAVFALYTFGLDAVLNYVLLRIDGEERLLALKESAKSGLLAGGTIFGAYVLASQFTKTGIGKNLFRPTAEMITKRLGPQFAERFLSAFGRTAIVADGATVAETTTTRLADSLKFNAVFQAAILIVTTIPDIVDVFRGRISKTQFVKNLSVAAATIAAGSVGAWLGGMAGSFLPGPGNIIGGIVGGAAFGLAGHYAGDWLSDYLAPDDADKMYEIVQDEFVALCDDYLVNEDEAGQIAETVGKMLDEDLLKDMYQSNSRHDFIRNKMEPIFEAAAAKREKIEMPSEEEMRAALLETMDGLVFIH